MSSLNNLPKVSYVWFKRNSDNPEVFELPTISNEKYEGVYKKTNKSKELAIASLKEDNNVDIALEEQWFLMKVKLVNTFVTIKEIKGTVSKVPEVSIDKVEKVEADPVEEVVKKRRYTRRKKSVDNGASPASA